MDDNPVGNAPPAAVQRNTVDHVKRKFEQKIIALKQVGCYETDILDIMREFSEQIHKINEVMEEVVKNQP